MSTAAPRCHGEPVRPGRSPRSIAAGSAAVLDHGEPSPTSRWRRSRSHRRSAARHRRTVGRRAREPALAARSTAPSPNPIRRPSRNTKAIVVVQDGRVIAERYADGVGIDTPLLGWSATKSVTYALIGILVRQGRLARRAGADRGLADPGRSASRDHRRSICCATPRAWLGNSLQRRSASAFDPVNRMKFMETDMAAFAGSAARDRAGQRPGTTRRQHLLLSQLIRQPSAAAVRVLRFARHELFDKLGMRHVTLEFDAAGTPIGSSHMLASARDWARFGLLYLERRRGRRRAPSAARLGRLLGRGDAGQRALRLWRGLLDQSRRRRRTTLPHRSTACRRDAFFARGVDRAICHRHSLAASGRRPLRPYRRTGRSSADGVFQLVSDVIAATSGKAQLAGGN